MDLLEKLDKEITEQTRNGRENIYVDVKDLEQLGYKIDKNKQGRIYVDLNILKLYINKYKFKDGLKVQPQQVQKQETFKDLEKDIKRIEDKTPDESWDSVTK